MENKFEKPFIKKETITAEEIKEYLEGLENKLKPLREKYGRMAVHEILCNLVDGLELKYKEQARKCAAFHKIIGSTPPPLAEKGLTWDGWIFDFGGDDSIESFIDKQLAKIEEEK